MAQSTIEWTESTWNPLTGCTEDRPGLQVLLCGADGEALQAMNRAAEPVMDPT